MVRIFCTLLVAALASCQSFDAVSASEPTATGLGNLQVFEKPLQFRHIEASDSAWPHRIKYDPIPGKIRVTNKGANTIQVKLGSEKPEVIEIKPDGHEVELDWDRSNGNELLLRGGAGMSGHLEVWSMRNG